MAKRNPNLETGIAVVAACAIIGVTMYLENYEPPAPPTRDDVTYQEAEDGSWSFAARSKKGGLLYREKLQETVKKVNR